MNQLNEDLSLQLGCQMFVVETFLPHPPHPECHIRRRRREEKMLAILTAQFSFSAQWDDKIQHCKYLSSPKVSVHSRGLKKPTRRKLND